MCRRTSRLRRGGRCESRGQRCQAWSSFGRQVVQEKSYFIEPLSRARHETAGGDRSLARGPDKMQIKPLIPSARPPIEYAEVRTAKARLDPRSVRDRLVGSQSGWRDRGKRRGAARKATTIIANSSTCRTPSLRRQPTGAAHTKLGQRTPCPDRSHHAGPDWPFAMATGGSRRRVGGNRIMAENTQGVIRDQYRRSLRIDCGVSSRLWSPLVPRPPNPEAEHEESTFKPVASRATNLATKLIICVGDKIVPSNGTIFEGPCDRRPWGRDCVQNGDMRVKCFRPLRKASCRPLLPAVTIRYRRDRNTLLSQVHRRLGVRQTLSPGCGALECARGLSILSECLMIVVQHQDEQLVNCSRQYRPCNMSISFKT